jgi:hypothetical protein
MNRNCLTCFLGYKGAVFERKTQFDANQNRTLGPVSGRPSASTLRIPWEKQGGRKPNSYEPKQLL